MKTCFDSCRAIDLPAQLAGQRWLVEQLWSEQAVGVVGGEPKCCKSFLALEVAVAVASGAPCLGRFAVRSTGPALVFAAEDAQHVVRERLAGLAQMSSIDFAHLDVHVITAPTVRLDVAEHQRLLAGTVAKVQPRLLVLDPFVRLHRCDENASREVAPMLSFLRELQRNHGAAVLLVHHARKSGAARAGQALRGSSEIHAWGDSNLYLRRKGATQLQLTIEHRAAAAIAPLALELETNADGAARLHIVGDDSAMDPLGVQAATAAPVQRVVRALEEAAQPLAMRSLRAACKMRTTSVYQAVDELVRQGRVCLDNGIVNLI